MSDVAILRILHSIQASLTRLELKVSDINDKLSKSIRKPPEVTPEVTTQE